MIKFTAGKYEVEYKNGRTWEVYLSATQRRAFNQDLMVDLEIRSLRLKGEGIGNRWQKALKSSLALFCGILLSCNIAYAEMWTATAYCPCKQCCGKTDGITASGIKAKEGITCAVNWLPFGTLVSVNGETFIVEDRGARSDFGDKKHHNKRIDIYFNTHKEARKFGRKSVDVCVL